MQSGAPFSQITQMFLQSLPLIISFNIVCCDEKVYLLFYGLWLMDPSIRWSTPEVKSHPGHSDLIETIHHDSSEENRDKVNYEMILLNCDPHSPPSIKLIQSASLTQSATDID